MLSMLDPKTTENCVVCNNKLKEEYYMVGSNMDIKVCIDCFSNGEWFDIIGGK